MAGAGAGATWWGYAGAGACGKLLTPGGADGGAAKDSFMTTGSPRCGALPGEAHYGGSAVCPIWPKWVIS